MILFKEDSTGSAQYDALIGIVAFDEATETNYYLTYMVDSTPNREYWDIPPKKRNFDLVRAQLVPIKGQLRRAPRYTINYSNCQRPAIAPTKITLAYWDALPALPDMDKQDNSRVRNSTSSLDSADYGY